MKKFHVAVLILAVLTALLLCACGDTSAVSSAPDGIEVFGFQIDPSAQPSMGQTVPGGENPPAAVSQDAPVTSTGIVIEGDMATSIQPSPSPSSAPVTTRPASPSQTAAPVTRTPASAAPAVSPDTPVSPGASASPNTSPRPSGSDTPVSAVPSGSDEPVSSPAISPPAPASTATISDASAYVGKSLSSLIAELGYPYSSDYEDVVEGDPDTDRIGTLYFDGFIVTTLRTTEDETVTAVVPN
ncbi:MAG: hypothetical protein IJ206_01180 [Oscillospiraceae bacterium]|nr:hypothetical protein [Oscillospiraceae bacterium]